MVIGWDISTSAIGICVKEDDGKTVEFSVIFPKGDTHLKKHADAVVKVNQFIEKYKDKKLFHFVEDRLGGFTGGLTTKQTLMALASMNAVISLTLSYTGEITHIPPVTTKRIMELKVEKGEDKKLIVVKLAKLNEPLFPYSETKNGNYVKGTDDMADAWLLAEAGRKILAGDATIGSKQKTPSNKTKAGQSKKRIKK